jgi:tetratricopeptide (TPR) repeat protein
VQAATFLLRKIGDITNNLDTTATEAFVNRFARSDVLRILHVTPRQFSGWQKAGLIANGESFTFFDLLQLKKVRDLRARKVRPAVIRESLLAMRQQAAGMENPLVEGGAFSVGSRVVFRHEGRSLDPIGGQFFMEFEPTGKLLPGRAVKPISQLDTVTEYFARGIALEEDSNSAALAMEAYNKVLELEPNYGPAHINLGTLHYNQEEFGKAEQHYRAAIACDARYALAWFDLGNVLDETGRILEAIRAYETAVALAPTYADAHYNLALAHERNREPRKALRHWRSYRKLDSNGPWAVHAYNQIKRILKADRLKLVRGR